MKNILLPGIALALAAAACSAELNVKAPEVKLTAETPKPKLALVGAQIDIKGDIEFDKNQATIRDTPASREVLEEVLKIMKENPGLQKVRIEGHTDNDGSDSVNEKLSQERAAAVEKWLVEHGIDDNRMDPIGCGARDPLYPNDSTEHKARNRRTEFDVEQLDGKPPADLTAPCAPNPHRKI